MTFITRYLLISVGLFSIVASDMSMRCLPDLPARSWLALGFAIGWIPTFAMLFFRSSRSPKRS